MSTLEQPDNGITRFERAGKRIDPFLKIAQILGVLVAVVAVAIATVQILEIKNQNTRQARIASATLTLKFRDMLDKKEYAELTAAIQNNDQKFPLLATVDGGDNGKFRSLEIKKYVGNFENLGYLIKEQVIDGKMAYNYFSYDVEKAWCNADVRKVVRIARQNDKSQTASLDALFGNFEGLAQAYLTREAQSCPDLDKQ